ncbi:MAG: hypothetical protein LBP40_07440 [Campylobacteraceae bacterium]|nr:hypothetical protein [Campylobacteraceae bacterium]
MILNKVDSGEIDSSLFKQVFPEIKGREAIKMTAKLFANDISGSLASYETALENNGFSYDTVNEIYSKRQNGIFYACSYDSLEKVALWIVARDDLSYRDLGIIFGL